MSNRCARRWCQAIFAGGGFAAAMALAATPEPPAGRLDRAVIPTHYSIELSIDPSKDRFAGSVAIDVEFTAPADGFWLHGKGLAVSEIYLTDGAARRIAATYSERLESGVARVTLEQTVAAGPARLHFVYSAPFNTATNALFKTVRGDLAYAATQFEPIAARQVFPSFDEPGFKVPFDLAVIARESDVVIATTPETAVQDLGDGSRRHVFRTTRPLPTYLIALAVGPYDVVDDGPIPPNAVRSHPLALRGVAARGQGERIHYALRNTAALLEALERYFGTPYPYEKLDLIAMPDNFGGAMENAGAITYDEILLLMDDRSPLDQRRSYASVHAHELAHMWFGDLVTPAWWNDIWLNESFATWMQDKAAQAWWPEGEFGRETLGGALAAMADDSLASARQIREPIADSDEINGAFDGITYQKGSGVLAMLERYVGEQAFQEGVRRYLQRHADGTATAEDFIASVANGSHSAEIARAFQSFIAQPGVPLVSVAVACDGRNNPRLTLQQARYAPLGSTIRPESGQWQIPFCTSWQAGGGRSSRCDLLTERRQSIELGTGACPAALLPNADGAGYYRFAMDKSGWRSLLEAVADLKPTEALVLGDSLDAGFRAGIVSPALYVSGLTALVNHDAWDVSSAAADALERITGIFDPEQLATIEPALAGLVAPRYARLAGATDPASQLLRKRLQRFLVVVARDPTTRKPLADQAARTVGLNGEPDASAADAAELETVLTVGVQDLGEPMFDRVMQLISGSEDPAYREAAIGALARVEDPVLVRKLQSAILARAFRGTEVLPVLSRQFGRPATTEQTYVWFRQNADAVIALLPEYYRATVVPRFGSAFCSASRAEEWQSFMRSKADALPGYERDLAQTAETIHLCAALRDAGARGLAAALVGH